MGPNLLKMSEDDLYKRLGALQSRLVWAGQSTYGGQLVQQIQNMMDEITGILRDRTETAIFQQNVLSKPAVVDIEGPLEKVAVETNSRAKSKSDIITRLRRSATPTTLKDA